MSCPGRLLHNQACRLCRLEIYHGECGLIPYIFALIVLDDEVHILVSQPIGHQPLRVCEQGGPHHMVIAAISMCDLAIRPPPRWEIRPAAASYLHGAPNT